MNSAADLKAMWRTVQSKLAAATRGSREYEALLLEAAPLRQVIHERFGGWATADWLR